MKKLYNKALMYQAFFNGKWPLLAGGMIFAYICYYFNVNRAYFLKFNISNLITDSIQSIEPLVIVLLCLLLFVLYVTITGINKRNTIMFLNSGPYTREEIKKNEILFLLGSLLFFVIIYIYITLCFIFKEKELMMIASNVLLTILLDIIKLILVGVAFIYYLELFDMLFSNTFVTIISMGVIPIGVFYLLIMLVNIAGRIPYRIDMYMNSVIRSIEYFLEKFVQFFFTTDSIEHFNLVDFMIPIISTTVGIIILYIIVKILNKKASIEKMNKIFVFSFVEKWSYYFISFCISLTIVNVLIQLYRELVLFKDLKYNEIVYSYNTPMALLYMGISIVAAIIISIIIKKVLVKIIKKIV